MLKAWLSFIFSYIFAFIISTNTYFSPKNVGSLSDSLKYFKILAVGDLMCHVPQITNAYNDSLKNFDFKPGFELVEKILKDGDLVIANLETVFAGKEFGGYSGYPHFNSPDEFLNALFHSGFNVLVTANNHSLDRGTNGLLRTAQLIDNLGMIRIGTFSSQHDRDSIRIFEKNGFRISILNYTYDLNHNHLKGDYSFYINTINDSLIKNDIENSKKLDADAIIVYFHFGEEYQRIPNTYQKEIVDKTFQYGADIILASHPHVLQPIELRSLSDPDSVGTKLDTGFVAYSLGNFISNQQGIYKQSGVILELKLEKNLQSNKVRISSIDFHPTWVFIGRYKNGNNHIIIPLEEIDSIKLSSRGFSFSAGQVKQMNRAFFETENHLSQHIKNTNIFRLGEKNSRTEE